MVGFHKQLITCLLTLFVAACGGAGTVADEAPEDGVVPVYLVKFGWHADLVIPTQTCHPLPESTPDRYRNAEHVVISWGDAHYYPAENPGVLTALRAALFPTSSVLLVRTLDGPVHTLLRNRESMRVDLTATGCASLGEFIRESFVVEDSALVLIPTDRQINASFFLGTDDYHLFHNCNHWTAEALRAAGLAISPWKTPTVGLLWRAVQRSGRAARPE